MEEGRGGEGGGGGGGGREKRDKEGNDNIPNYIMQLACQLTVTLEGHLGSLSNHLMFLHGSSNCLLQEGMLWGCYMDYHERASYWVHIVK